MGALLVLVLIAVLVTLAPMDARLKTTFIWILIVLAILWLLSALGLFGALDFDWPRR
jgi:hypothetical protein